MNTALSMSRPVSVLAALLSLWLLGMLGFTTMLRLTGPWLFLPTDDFWVMFMMLGGFYAARVASLFPALCVASIVIAHSHFTRPYRVFAGIVAGSYLVGFLVRWALKQPAWELVSESAPGMAFVFELLSAAGLAGVGTLFLYFYRTVLRRSHQFATNG